MAFSFIAMSMFTACNDDMEYQGIQDVNQDTGYLTLNLNYQSQNDKVVEVSRSAASALEKRLFDLHFYVFDEEGNLTGYKEVLPEGENDVIEEAGNTERVSIRTKSGPSYIYGIANINSSSTYYLAPADSALLNIDEGESEEEYRANIETSALTREKFLSIKFQRLYGNENEIYSPDPAGNVFVMSGYINEGGLVDIPKPTNGQNSATLATGNNIIKLYRILAKNTFTITSGTGNGKFTPKYYRLCNVPKSGVLIPKAGISTTNNYLDKNTTLSEVESSYQWNFEGKNQVTFYLPENLQIAKDTVNRWKDREKNSWNGNAKTFTKAADKATYVEIHGDYVDNLGDVTANVSYTIHLGNFSKAGSLNDYNVIRNHNYSYNVTVNGVNDIVVEATTATDNPYAEGLVVNATDGKHYDLDAHYEARVFKFTKQAILDLKAAYNNAGTGYILNIKTPFGATEEPVNVRPDGIYKMGATKPFCSIAEAGSIFPKGAEADYLWMKFVRNTDDNTMFQGADISKYPCKYPGDENEFQATHGKWMNVFELLAELYDENTYTDKNGTEAYYTCFIDEYYYQGKSWPEYVNKEPRTMLIANELSISPDGKSLYAEVAYSISQRSITTFYQTDYIYPLTNKQVKAFGTEIIDEEDVYQNRLSNNAYSDISHPDEWKAWTSAYYTNNGKQWYSGYNQRVDSIQPLYTSVAKACMSRNRDLNGNGQIDKNEVRWYLPAIDQYRALFFGQNALNVDAYLISQGELQQIADALGSNNKGHEERSKYHYFSCSGGNNTTFWPEEGLTNNPMNNSYSWAELVRCVRTLESEGDGIEDPEPFYTYNNNTFFLDGIKATRGYRVDPLENHNEIQPLNNLYSSFVVAKEDLSSVDRWNNVSYNFILGDITGQAADPCSKYAEQVKGTDEAAFSWRTPNQKELALMVTEISELSKNRYGTRTKFSGDDGEWDWHTTDGIWSDIGQNGEGARINVGTGYEGGVRIRCVRDNKR